MIYLENKMERKIFFVEGECEKVFIENMYNNGYDKFTGRKNIEIFNICYDDIKKIKNKFSMRNIDIYFVFDTDILVKNEKNEQNNFMKNFNLLKNTENNKYYIIQVKDFEDELVHSCTKLSKESDLFALFNAKNKKECKSHFISQNNRLNKLNGKGFDISKLWCQKTPSILSQYKIARKQGKDFQYSLERQNNMTKTAFFFPGQGSQSLQMMAGFAGESIVKQTFDEASDALNQDLWAMIHAESADLINQTENTQPIMLAAGFAVWRVYQARGGKTPSVLAGHSLGEYTALTVAGSLNFADAIQLVRTRANLMQTAVPQGKGAMAAVLGLDDNEVIAVCQEAAQGEVVEAVNFNSVGQVVIAGDTVAVNRAMEIAKNKGAKRALLLPVSVPSHCALMKPAAEKLVQAFENVAFRLPEIPVIHNADVASYNDLDKIKDALARQLYSPVRWTETVRKVVADGITQSAECAPGKVLAGLVKRTDKNLPCAALTDIAAVEELIAGQN